MGQVNTVGCRQSFDEGYRRGYLDALEQTREIVSRAANQIPNVIQVNIDPNRLMQLEEENCRLRAVAEMAKEVIDAFRYFPRISRDHPVITLLEKNLAALEEVKE